MTENIFVVKRSTLFPDKAFQGLQEITDADLERIHAAQEFHPRPQMEEDLNYKQIIPYLVFTHNNRYFLMQRRSDSSEQRLKNKYSLGIGGHIRQEDIADNSSIFAWAHREFNEEIHYQGTFSISTLGMLNDDSNPVGQVHVGLILLLQGDSDAISVRSELKSGHLLSAHECLSHYEQMESWSQIIFDSVIRPSV